MTGNQDHRYRMPWDEVEGAKEKNVRLTKVAAEMVQYKDAKFFLQGQKCKYCGKGDKLDIATRGDLAFKLTPYQKEEDVVFICNRCDRYSQECDSIGLRATKLARSEFLDVFEETFNTNKGHDRAVNWCAKKLNKKMPINLYTLTGRQYQFLKEQLLEAMGE